MSARGVGAINASAIKTSAINTSAVNATGNERRNPRRLTAAYLTTRSALPTIGRCSRPPSNVVRVGAPARFSDARSPGWTRRKRVVHAGEHRTESAHLAIGGAVSLRRELGRETLLVFDCLGGEKRCVETTEMKAIATRRRPTLEEPADRSLTASRAPRTKPTRARGLRLAWSCRSLAGGSRPALRKTARTTTTRALPRLERCVCCG